MDKRTLWRLVLHVVFVCTVAASLLFSFWAAHRLFGWTIRSSDFVPYSPIMMFQGAPRSHYEEEHRFALFAYDLLETPLGKWMATMALMTVSLGWGLALLWLRSSLAKVLISAILIEGTLWGLNVFFAGAMAYHNVGWGLGCCYQWWGDLVVLHFFLGLPPFAAVLIYLNYLLPPPWRQAEAILK